jgi:hypothetical protein
VTGGASFECLPIMTDHDLTDAYGYARGLLAHDPEPWVAAAVSGWVTGAEAELARRGLLKEAKRTRDELWRDHHAQPTAATGKGRVVSDADALFLTIAARLYDFESWLRRVNRNVVAVRKACEEGREHLIVSDDGE